MLQIRGRLLLFWVAVPFEGLGLSLLCILVGVLCELCGKKDFDREERKGIAKFAKHSLRTQTAPRSLAALMKTVASTVWLCHNSS
jgi:hypothetical protein